MNDICTRMKYFFVRHTHVIQPKDVHIYMMYVYMLRKMFPCQHTVPPIPYPSALFSQVESRIIYHMYSHIYIIHTSVSWFQYPGGCLALP